MNKTCTLREGTKFTQGRDTPRMTTERQAFKSLLDAEQIERLGRGVRENPYFKLAKHLAREPIPVHDRIPSLEFTGPECTIAPN
jgi:hypothetical protein